MSLPRCAARLAVVLGSLVVGCSDSEGGPVVDAGVLHDGSAPDIDAAAPALDGGGVLMDARVGDACGPGSFLKADRSCGTWKAPVTLAVVRQESTARMIARASVAMNGSGDALALWHVRRHIPPYAGTLWVSRLARTQGSWQEPVRISAPEEAELRDEGLWLSDPGQAVAHWSQISGYGLPASPLAQTGTVAKTFDPDAGWKETQRLHEGYPEWELGFAFNRKGEGVLVEADIGDAGIQLTSHRYAPDADWSARPLPINTFVEPVPSKLALAEDGRLYILWSELDAGGRKRVWLDVVSATDAPIKHAIVNDESREHETAAHVDLVIDRSGAVTVAWSEFDGQQTRFYVDRSADGVTWGPDTELRSPSSGGGGAPRLSVDDAGRVVALWRSDVDEAVYSARWTGTSWEPAERIPVAVPLSPAGTPFAGSDSAGNLIAVIHTASEGVWVAHRPAQGPWSSAFKLIDAHEQDAGGAGAGSLAVDQAGNALIGYQLVGACPFATSDCTSEFKVRAFE